MEKLIALENITKTYYDKTILDNISMDIFKNELLAITGPNGTGKSTLLKIISGLTSISSGKRIVHNEGEKIKIGYVPDRFPKLNFTPSEYLFYMGKLQGLSKEFIKVRCNELFAMFNMDRMKDTRIKYLSKGTIQKVSVMQAVMVEPDILLLDEPISGQDSESESNFINMLEEFRKTKLSIVLACHEMYLVEKLADRVINIRDGKIHSDYYKNRDKQYMKICFSLNDSTEIEIEDLILECKEKDYRYIIIEKKFSDRSILKLLQTGATIVSVNSYWGEELG
ncbi:ABC transporter ATP-binding protein [Clostridium neuense]|uniref:ABC transporter ATP-binding protein n=1 Tax=Clostridium neuense TaxID=1728934 RepID=A0ABW8TJI6_9CLOT